MWAETTITCMRDAAGKIIGILGVTHDITQPRRVEAGVRELIFKADAAEDLCEAFVRLAQTVQGTSKSS